MLSVPQRVDHLRGFGVTAFSSTYDLSPSLTASMCIGGCLPSFIRGSPFEFCNGEGSLFSGHGSFHLRAGAGGSVAAVLR